MGLDHIPGILPSERESFDRAKDCILFLEFMADKASSIGRLLAVAEIAAQRLIPTDSTNSDKPTGKGIGPTGKPTKKGGGRKPGGQKGHPGNALNQFEKPDKVARLTPDPKLLPPGYRLSHIIKRQVVSVEMARIVLEYWVEVWTNEQGETFETPMPEGVAGHPGVKSSEMIPIEEFNPNDPTSKFEVVTVKPDPASSPDDTRGEAEPKPIPLPIPERKRMPERAPKMEPLPKPIPLP
jgi:hypothetical protein